jgi:hypothetical protein
VVAGEGALWVTVAGASRAVAVGWLAWVMAAVGGASLLSPHLGPAGTILLVLAIGWVLARRLPPPSEWRRRYHLDDAEVTAIGPGAAVCRLPWAAVLTVGRERDVLRVAGPGARLRVPIGAVEHLSGWHAVLARMASEIADGLWAHLEDGEALRLAPPQNPSLRAFAWWALVPAAGACLAAGGAQGFLLAAGVVAAERVVTRLRASAQAVTLGQAGIIFRRAGRRACVPWAGAEIEHTSAGLVVRAPGGAPYVLPADLPNFAAVAPVVEMKAQLGPFAPAAVRFRVRRAGAGLAVVGEVEPSA